MSVVGFLGVGHLAGYLLEGFRHAGIPLNAVLLSPRGHKAELMARAGWPMAENNTDLVARSDIVVLSVRPPEAVGAVTGLPWRAGQLLLSVCAGVPIADLSAAARPAAIARAMPISAAAIGASPTTLYPEEARARKLLKAVGPVLALANEEEFETASISGALYGWVHALIGHSAAWSERHGLDPVVARRLSALTFLAAARMVEAQEHVPVAELVERLSTPGGITECGLRVLAANGGYESWGAACDATLAHLRRLTQ